MRRTLLVILVISLCIPALSQSKRAKIAEQTIFDVEQEDVGAPIVRPVPIPPEVLKLLSTSDRVKDCELPATGLPADWFIASEIHLHSPEQADLIVQERYLNGDRAGENSCLAGANIGPFWVFRITPAGYSLLLDLATKNLKILNSRTNGYRDIQLMSNSASTYSVSILKFDGTKYRLIKSTTSPSGSDSKKHHRQRYKSALFPLKSLVALNPIFI